MTLSSKFKSALSELQKIAPQFSHLSGQLNALFWEKENERIALCHERRDLELTPPGRDEGMLFFNSFLDEMERTATARMRVAFSGYATGRDLHSSIELMRTIGTGALQPNTWSECGLAAFLIPVMRASINDLLEKIDWPVGSISNAARSAKMDELQKAIDVVSSEADDIRQKMAELGLAPWHPDDSAGQ